jgi:hypothetical protein
MRKSRTAAILVAGLVAAALAALDEGALAGGDHEPQCSVKSLAGRWLFATDIARFPNFGGDITALGTMNIDWKRNVEGSSISPSRR